MIIIYIYSERRPFKSLEWVHWVNGAAYRTKINVSKTRKFVINRKCFQLHFSISYQLDVGEKNVSKICSSDNNYVKFKDYTPSNLCLLNRNFVSNKVNSLKGALAKRIMNNWKHIAQKKNQRKQINAMNGINITRSVCVMCGDIWSGDGESAAKREHTLLLRVRYMPIWDLLLS